MMKTSFFSSLAVAGFVISSVLTPAHASDSIYGALYEGGNLVSTNGDSINTESVLTYHSDYAGFVAITTNSAGAEWWVSNAAGTVWEQSTTNPLDGYGCTGVSRHAISTYNSEVYFGAQCEEDGIPTSRIFKLTSKDTVELMHSRTASTEDFSSYYPAAGVVGGNLYMFYNGGFTQYDGTTFTDIEDAVGQTGGTPLEVTRAVDGVAYLPQVGGSVQAFDGTEYTTIGEEYLEGIVDNSDHNSNLPSAAVFNGTLYVGNQDFDNGATLYSYDETDADADSELWEIAADFEAEDTIINKMQVSERIDGDRYLVIYTANAVTGSNIYVMDTAGTVQKLVDSGLGETSPENNVEVLSAIRRTVTYGLIEKDVMVFATKNFSDQTKVFVLNLDTRLAFDALSSRIMSVVEESGMGSARISAQSMEVAEATTTAGEAFTYEIKKKRIQTGAVYSLWIDGVQVDEMMGQKGYPVSLSYEGASTLESGATFDVQIGVQSVYGRRAGKVLSTNIIKGESLTVTVE